MKDNSNNIRAKYVYDAWGNHKVYNASGVEQTSSTFVGNINPIRYRGYYYDTESDMYYCKSRYYKPQINRWINMDDISYLDKKTSMDLTYMHTVEMIQLISMILQGISRG